MNNNSNKLLVSASPHIQNYESTKSIMWTVIIFLIPAALFGVLSFGFNALNVIVASIVTSVITEIIAQKLRNQKITINDGSAVLTGLLLAMTLAPSVPLYIPIISAIFAIGIVKHAFGGLGQNWANPAIAGRIFAFVAWGKEMTTWSTPFTLDGTTAATPLLAVKSAMMEGISSNFSGPLTLLQSLPKEILKIDIDYTKLFFGYKGGSIGEVSIFLLLVGALYLLYRGIITIDIPFSFIGTVVIIAWVFDGTLYGKGYFTGDFVFHLLTGGIVLGAFFMATDMVTTPITKKGRIIFGIGCGFLTMIIRMKGGYPEGVSLAILFMNMLTPAIDRFIKIKPFGFEKSKEVK